MLNKSPEPTHLNRECRWNGLSASLMPEDVSKDCQYVVASVSI